MDSTTEFARGYLEELLTFFGINTSVAAAREGDTIELTVDSDTAGHVIGHRGETLAALQHIINMAARQRSQERVYVHVDIGGYRKARLERLEAKAREVAAEVLDSGEERPLPGMNPAERRHIHAALNDVEGVTTESRGEGKGRRLVVKKSG